MKKIIFEGAAVAIITPFNSDGTVNYEQLKNLIEFQIANGTDAIVSCGTTGESSTLSQKEHLEVVEFTAKAINKRIPLIASAGSNDTSFAVEMAKESEKLGADGLLLITPYYNKTSQKGLVESFNKIADSTNVPGILYNVPSRTGVNILPETYLELSKHPNIVATKEANHDISSVAKTMSLCGDNLTFYSGEDDQVLPMMALGGKGVISVFSNVMPKQMKAICSAMLQKDYATAQRILFEHIKLMNALFADVNPIPVKEALHQMGYCSNQCRLPLTTMDESGIAKLTDVLKEYNLIS